MFYKFPVIYHVDQVRDAIDGRDEFFIADRDWYQVANYTVNLQGSFLPVDSEKEALIRECRGLVFDKDGNVLARRYQKFFNLNEREETRIENIDWSRHHVILEKLDGSMVTPLWDGQKTRWGTKMGITDGFSDMVEEFVEKHPQYKDVATVCRTFNCTPIFEWCSRKTRIVVDHPEDRLVLCAIRENRTGEYWTYYNMVHFAETMEIDYVKAFEGTVENIMELARTQQEGEGWVIRFDNGHMLKVKTDAYCAIHKAKSMLTSEKAVLECIVNQGIDDLIPILYKEDADALIAYHDAFWKGVRETVSELESGYEIIRERYDTKRDFAIASEDLDQRFRSMVFSLWDRGGTAEDEVMKWVKKSISTNRKIDENRDLWGNARWKYADTENME